MTTSIESRSGLVVDVVNVLGGDWSYSPDFKPSKFFLPKDYDQSESLKQWYSQTPLGYQTIFSLETIFSSKHILISNHILSSNHIFSEQPYSL